MATILKRPSGRYQAQVCVNGKRRAKSFTKLSDARRWVALIEQDLLNSEDPASSLPTSKFIKDYLDTVGARLKNHKCLSEILGFISETQLGDIPLRSVSKKHIEAWIEHRRTVPSRTTGALVKESTIARQFQMLSGFFSWAVQKELLKENPCHGVRKPKDSQPRERVTTYDEIERIKHVAGWVEGTPPKTKTQRVDAAFVLSCFTGMRAGEILKLERQWINGARRHPHLSRSSALRASCFLSSEQVSELIADNRPRASAACLRTRSRSALRSRRLARALSRSSHAATRA